MKKMTVIALAAFLFAGSAYAVDLATLKAEPTVDPDGTIQLNNTLCPVSGDEIAKSSESSKHDGVVYKFCCPMCSGKLEKNLEKYEISETDKEAILGKAQVHA